MQKKETTVDYILSNGSPEWLKNLVGDETHDKAPWFWDELILACHEHLDGKIISDGRIHNLFSTASAYAGISVGTDYVAFRNYFLEKSDE